MPGELAAARQGRQRDGGDGHSGRAGGVAQYPGQGVWALFPRPERYRDLASAVGTPPGTDPSQTAPRLAPTATPTPRPATDPRAGCDSSCPTIRLPPPPPDLDCQDIPYKNFPVKKPDPHRLDSDSDGIGCES